MQPRRTALYLFRHGEVDERYRPCTYGHLDISLSERGIRQSEAIQDVLARIPLEAVYSSDLERAAYAARLVCESLGVAPINLPDFREIGMGDWEGRIIAELSREYEEKFASFYAEPLEFCFPGGESCREFIARVDGGLSRILSSHEGNMALIAHSGVCRAILGAVLEIPPTNWLRITQDFGCMNIIEWYDGQPVVKLMNYPPSGAPHNANDPVTDVSKADLASYSRFAPSQKV
ncbi:MAG TPA: histidine phosphatase family protein [Blastocatellia bacterium]